MVDIDVKIGEDGRKKRLGVILAKLQQELGPKIIDALRDPRVTDVWGNEDGSVWVNAAGRGAVPLNLTIGRLVGLSLIGTISGYAEQEVSERRPFLFAELPAEEPFLRARFSAAIPPITRAPVFAIRRHATLSKNLDDYLKEGTLTTAQRDALRKKIKERANIIVAGGQGSGKTTLVNAILREMVELSNPAEERFAILEDTPELQMPPGLNNYFTMRTNDGTSLELEELMRRSLRFTGNRYVIGELRGPEAQVFLEACASGHPGALTTIHAGSPNEVLLRFEQLLRKATNPHVDPAEIARAINVIIVIARTPRGRIIRDMVQVDGGSAGGYRFSALR